jgi:hypothetical protein
MRFEEQFPALNFFLHRRHDFVPTGRFEDEENSRKVEQKIKEMAEKLFSTTKCVP